MKKNGGDEGQGERERATKDDTKSISPSRHVLPISRMNGMFSSLHLFLSHHGTFELILGRIIVKQ